MIRDSFHVQEVKDGFIVNYNCGADHCENEITALPRDGGIVGGSKMPFKGGKWSITIKRDKDV